MEGGADQPADGERKCKGEGNKAEPKVGREQPESAKHAEHRQEAEAGARDSKST